MFQDRYIGLLTIEKHSTFDLAEDPIKYKNLILCNLGNSFEGFYNMESRNNSLNISTKINFDSFY